MRLHTRGELDLGHTSSFVQYNCEQTRTVQRVTLGYLVAELIGYRALTNRPIMRLIKQLADFSARNTSQISLSTTFKMYSLGLRAYPPKRSRSITIRVEVLYAQ